MVRIGSTTPARARQRSAALAPVILSTALALAGCSGGSTEATEAEASPLSEYLSAIWGSTEYSDEDLAEMNRESEELIAECMAEEGFEYQPDTSAYESMMTSADDTDEEIDWSSLEFAEKYGYGIHSYPGSDEPVSEDEYIDPNADYVDSLSDSEQNAYWETLYGKMTDSDLDDSGEGSTSLEDMGCSGQAQLEFNSDLARAEQAYEDPEFSELLEEAMAVQTIVWETPATNADVAELDQEWAACMSDAGLPDFTSPSSAQEELSSEYDEFMYPDDGGEASDETVKAFQKREIEVATADYTCQDKLSYQDKILKIQFQLEEEFIAENQTALDALVAKYGADSQ